MIIIICCSLLYTKNIPVTANLAKDQCAPAIKIFYVWQMAMHSSTKASTTFPYKEKDLKTAHAHNYTEREEKRLFNVVEQRNREQLFISARARPFIKTNHIALGWQGGHGSITEKAYIAPYVCIFLNKYFNMRKIQAVPNIFMHIIFTLHTLKNSTQMEYIKYEGNDNEGSSFVLFSKWE